jgi:hypothetical protein
MTFLVIGAQKCATSWLYYCLAEHPALYLPRTKREVEYLGGTLHRERGDDWYLGLITPPADSHGAEARGDVSVQYLWDPAAPGETARVLPDARLIVSLRDPLERAVSSYFWNLRKGAIPAEVTLEHAVALGTEWLSACEEAGAIEPPPSPVEELVARSVYDVQLVRWMERFDPERFLVLDYRDIATGPEAVLDRVYGFLGVASHRPSALGRRPKRNSYALPLLFLERLSPRNRAWAALMDRLNRHWPGRGQDPVRRLPSAVRDGARAAFAPGMARTRALLKRIPPAQRPTHPSFATPPAGDA